MSQKKMPGYVKSENVIWFVVASLLIGFIGGVAYGIYQSGTIADPHQHDAPAAMDAQLQEKIAGLTAQIRDNPDELQAWIQLGHLYFDANQAEKAIDAYEKALALKPDDANVWTDLGVMYRRSGNPEKAVDAFDRAMNLDPSHEISRFNKGIVLFHDLKDEEGALAAWKQLLALNPNAKSPGGQTVRELVTRIEQQHAEAK